MSVIAIDGPTSSGKSTIAKLVGSKLGFTYVNSGLLYRTITYLLTKENESKINDLAFISAVLKKYDISYDNDHVFVDGKDITKEAKWEGLTRFLPEVSANEFIRNYVNDIIRKVSTSKDIIIDGRDIGTVVFPDATLKIYLVADVEVRAKRRYEESKKEGFTYEEVLERLKHRDFVDSTREVAPLKQASDAILIDSTNLTIDEIVDNVVNLYNEVI